MMRGEEDQKQSRGSARAADGKTQSGFGWMQMEKSPIGPSRFQVPLSQRNRVPTRKPPEPLRRAVAACLSAPHHPSSEAVVTLQFYLSNPSTVDLAYTVLLEHANAERERSPPVVARCVSLLKRYLVRYVPKHAMLQQVDTFCATLIAECSSTSKSSMGSTFLQAAYEPASSRMTSQVSTKAALASVALVKSLTYVRSLVARHLPSNLLQSTRIAELSNAYTKRSRNLYTAFGSPGMQGPSDDKDAAKPMSLHGPEENEEFITNNVLKWRWMGGKRNQCWTPSPVMTDSGGISRPQVKRLFEYADMGAGALFMRGSDFKGKKQQGKQAEKSLNPDSFGEQLLQPSKVTTITDPGSTQSHLRAIATSKRQKSQSQVWNPDVPKSTWRKRPRPLFQYKHYSEQQPLRLSTLEIEEVLSAFCAEGAVVGGGTQGIVPMLPVVHPGRVSFESADVAGSVLIKLIIDMYMANPITATPLTLSMLEGMLGSSSRAVRIRCFDLILNLGIHAHLLEPMQMEEQSALGEESLEPSALLASVGAFSSSKRGLNLEEAFRAEERLELMRPQESSSTFKAPVDKVDGATPEAVQVFELWLLQILFEMLLFLVQIRETEESIWVAALSCLLYFVCDGSRIQRHRLYGLDIRVLRNLLDISWASAWADELQCTLVCMMSNMLYKVGGAVDGGAGRNAEFNMEQLELLGGIDFVCLEYARAHSMEAKANLFCIVLDYVLHELNLKHLPTVSQPSADEIQAVVGALLLADGAEVIGFALKHGIKNVGEGLFETIATAISRDIDSGRLNSRLLQEITSMLDTLVVTFTQPDEEFSEPLSVTMAGQEPGTLNGSSADFSIASQAWVTLHSLLHSSKLSCRLHGYSWLSDLLSSEMARDSSGIFDNVIQQHVLNSSWSKGLAEFNEKTEMKSSLLVALHLLYGLLRSKHAVIRRGFVVVLERLLITCQNLAVRSTSMQLLEGENIVEETKSLLAEKWEKKLLALMNGALLQFVSENDTNHINILQMCNVMFTQLFITLPSPSSPANPSNTFMKDNMVFNRFSSFHNITCRNLSTFTNSGIFNSKQSRNGTADYRGYASNKCQSPTPVSSLAAMLLKGHAAAPRVLVASIPTHLLYWPLLQLAGAATEDMTLGVAVGSQGRGRTSGGASDVRAALLVLLIGKCSVQQSAFEEVGGEEFFRSLLTNDMDARVAYYTASFLLKRMMSEEPENYQRVLHTLVFRAQQCNNEKLLENPYLQMRGIMQLFNDPGGVITIHET